MMRSSAFGKSLCNSSAAPRFARSLSPQTTVAGHAIPPSFALKSSDRMDRASRIAPSFDNPMEANARFGMQRNTRF